MHILTVGAHAEHLRAAVAELAVELAEGRDLGRAHKSEVLRPEKQHLPFAGLVALLNGWNALAGSFETTPVSA